MSQSPSHAALSGVRVADFSRVLAGPFATMMLADFGADVIKIESPVGDETREWAPPLAPDGQSAYFGSVNRNKRSVVCDLSTDEGRNVARNLALTADVVVENFRPGVMSKFGLDYDSLREHNPGVIYCSITGFGSTEAGAELAGYDLLVQAMSGLMSITGQPDGEPTKVGVALVDVLCGQNAVAGILLALRAREHQADGHGQRVEVDLMSTALAALVNQASNALATGSAPTRMGNAHPSIAPYELFATADRPVILAVGSDRHFRHLCAALGLEALADDERFDTNPHRVAHRALLKIELEAVLATRTCDLWVESLRAAGIPVGPVNSVIDALSFADEIGLEPLVTISENGRSVTSVRSPIRLSESPPRYELAPPRLGEHSGSDWFDMERSADE